MVSMTMLLATSSLSFAETSYASVGVTKVSKTAAYTSASAHFKKRADYAKCTVTLQEKYSKGWRRATGLVLTQYIRIQYRVSSISAARTFSLLKGRKYRLKVGFTDKRGRTASTRYCYSTTF